MMNILAFNLRDNVNSYVMQEDGTYAIKKPAEGESEFNIHKEFFSVDSEEVLKVELVKP
jgi:polyphosphate kinase